MEKKRICCFCERWESGGIESFLNNILLNMDRTGLEVDIVAASVEDSVFTAGLEAAGVRVIELSGKLRSPENHRRFRKLLRERRYVVVHFNLFQGLSLYYARIAQQEGVPARIVHSHNTALRKSRTRWLKLALHRVSCCLWAGTATERWACSERAAEFLFPGRELARKGFRFIPNGIDTARFAFDPAVRETVRARLGLKDAFVVGNVGRLCYQKNQDFLLDVFQELAKRRPESRLLLVGEGEQKDALAEKAARLGIAPQVIFFGTSDRVEQLMWAMDVFAFPSLFEGLGIVAVEAQAAGLPVVCSEHVPSEAFVTPSAHVQPLASGAAGWADGLLSCDLDIPRGDMAGAVRKAGFDVSECAKAIQTKYLEI